MSTMVVVYNLYIRYQQVYRFNLNLELIYLQIHNVLTIIYICFQLGLGGLNESATIVVSRLRS